MVLRDGPYGDFWVCPNSTKKNPHPTRSLKWYEMMGDDDARVLDYELGLDGQSECIGGPFGSAY